jgi:hypothetical protein
MLSCIQQNLLTGSGQFYRVITLPDDIDPDRVEAQYREGITRRAGTEVRFRSETSSVVRGFSPCPGSH